MELHQLRYFTAVADLGSFTRAAQKCLVAQPSLSQQIIKLEKELGQPLFERLGRKVRMTDAGRVLYDQAVSVLTTVDDAKRRVAEAGEMGEGRIAIGAIPTVAPYLLPPLLKSFRQCCPHAEVTVYENLTRHTLAACLEGELDVALVALPIAEELLQIEPLFGEELLLAMAPDHPLAKRSRITMQDVSGESFILLDEAHCLGEQVVSFCKQESCLPATSCRSSQLLTVQELVRLGQGVSLIPAMAAALDHDGRILYRPLSGTKPTRTLALVWQTHRYQSRAVRQFLETVRQYASGLRTPVRQSQNGGSRGTPRNSSIRSASGAQMVSGKTKWT
jgi:LysR family hydrogen peroxide-inducible transcriptional activator